MTHNIIMGGSLTCQPHIHGWGEGEEDLQCRFLGCEGGVKALKGAPVL